MQLVELCYDIFREMKLQPLILLAKTCSAMNNAAAATEIGEHPGTIANSFAFWAIPIAVISTDGNKPNKQLFKLKSLNFKFKKFKLCLPKLLKTSNTTLSNVLSSKLKLLTISFMDAPKSALYFEPGIFHPLFLPVLLGCKFKENLYKCFNFNENNCPVPAGDKYASTNSCIH